ncbi:SDR family oxidoreductase [Jeongeupia chitinilytica]|uniref:Short-chain dehydrogenase n=1 Tax=Jeongeupia chitinilytica TaxID=1041641 RepID=A0ABQ3GZL0_9NEIS|nr:SDR family oxidoreductase [Jeongeupia chitinilytica]GHD61294.1 short-chain dehydrogenase [Jeongeupia chitinilytica]
MQELPRTALVCGGLSGLGQGVAEALRQSGHRVICTSSRPVAPGRHDVVPLDLYRPDSVMACLSALAALDASPDIVVINGPGPAKGTTADLSAQDWTDGFQSLWATPLALLSALLPVMTERGWGRVIWVTSVAASRYMPGMAISTSLRAGLHGLVTTLSAEYAAAGLTVNALAPGYHRTERLTQLGLDATVLARIPAGRLGGSDEFGQSAAFLASDAAAYVTGQVLVCDGGWQHGSAATISTFKE